MIPKIIHYCWLSGDPYPPKIKKCLKSWSKIIPNYELVLWDYQKCKEENILNDWVREAFINKKYAFASDFIRLYAVHKYGGIYLDTDIEVIKPFDDLLNLPYFIGKEAIGNRVEIAAFGAEKGCKWIELCLQYYKNRHFIKKDNSLDMKVMPDIVHETITPHLIINDIQNISTFNYDYNIFNIFPNDWFCANVYLDKSNKKPSYIVSDQTYCIHHFANTWLKDSKRNQIKQNIKNYIRKLNIFKNNKK